MRSALLLASGDGALATDDGTPAVRRIAESLPATFEVVVSYHGGQRDAVTDDARAEGVTVTGDPGG